MCVHARVCACVCVLVVSVVGSVCVHVLVVCEYWQCVAVGSVCVCSVSVGSVCVCIHVLVVCVSGNLRCTHVDDRV